jgi:hypothetical protein
MKLISTYCRLCRQQPAQRRAVYATLPRCATCEVYLRELYLGEPGDEDYADHLIRRAHYHNRHTAGTTLNVRRRRLV